MNAYACAFGGVASVALARFRQCSQCGSGSHAARVLHYYHPVVAQWWRRLASKGGDSTRGVREEQ